MKVDSHPCFILHSRPYRETSLLFDVFSREYGRVSLLAKGAKKNKKISHTYSQPYQLLDVAWTGKGELPILTYIELKTELALNKTEKMLAGFYLNELLTKLLHKYEPHPDLFEQYYLCLAKIADGVNIEFCLRVFEKHLLLAIGYALILDHDVQSNKLISIESQYIYDPFSGPTLCEFDQSKKKNEIIVSGKTLLGLLEENEKRIQLVEAKLLMRSVLQQYLGNEQLASRKLYQAYVQAN